MFDRLFACLPIDQCLSDQNCFFAIFHLVVLEVLFSIEFGASAKMEKVLVLSKLLLLCPKVT
jgi:hypothetical protein